FFGATGIGFQTRQEAITAPPYGLDEQHLRRGVSQRGAQLVHGRIQAAVEVHEGVRRPERLPEVVSRDHVAWTFDQALKDPERLLLQRDLLAVAAQLARARVELEALEPG